MNLSKDLAVVVYLTQTKIDNMRINANLHVDNENTIGLYSADSPNSVNALAKIVSADWFLLISEHESVTRQLAGQLLELRSHSPQTLLYFLQDDWDPKLAEVEPSDFVSQLFGLSPFGIFINRQFLLDLGGLSEQHTHAFDIELFLRCAKLGESRVASLPKSLISNIDRQVTAALLGPMRIVQISDLVDRAVGYSSPYWLGAYAAIGDKVIRKEEVDPSEQEAYKISLTLAGHRICRTIRPADQHLLGPHLRRSIFDDGLVHPVATDVDEALVELFKKPPQRLRLPGGFRAFSMGSNPETAQILKQIGLQRASGPFDWINTCPDVVEHILTDDFKHFLDPQWTKSQTKQGLFKAMQASREHSFYLEKFGQRSMFPFHDLRLTRDMEFYTSAIVQLRNRLNSNLPCCLVHVATSDQDPGIWRRLGDHLRTLGKRNSVVVVRLTDQPLKRRHQSGLAAKVLIRKWKNVLLADLVVQAVDKGLAFDQTEDSIRFVRLLHGLCLGSSGLVMEDTATARQETERLNP